MTTNINNSPKYACRTCMKQQCGCKDTESALPCHFYTEQPKQEPVGYFAYDEEHNIWEELTRPDAPGATPLYAAPVQQAEQEPVAWAHPSGGHLSARYMKEFATGLEKETHTIPLYAAPVQQVTRADLKAAFKEGFERAADLYAPNDGQEPYAYEVWDVQDQSFTMIYATQLKEFHWIEPENIARVLYAAPVRTKDLTEPLIDELRECRDLLMCVESCSRNNFENLAYERVQAIDAVIAVDREKNK